MLHRDELAPTHIFPGFGISVNEQTVKPAIPAKTPRETPVRHTSNGCAHCFLRNALQQPPFPLSRVEMISIVLLKIP